MTSVSNVTATSAAMNQTRRDCGWLRVNSPRPESSSPRSAPTVMNAPHIAMTTAMKPSERQDNHPVGFAMLYGIAEEHTQRTIRCEGCQHRGTGVRVGKDGLIRPDLNDVVDRYQRRHDDEHGAIHSQLTPDHHVKAVHGIKSTCREGRSEPSSVAS